MAASCSTDSRTRRRNVTWPGPKRYLPAHGAAPDRTRPARPGDPVGQGRLEPGQAPGHLAARPSRGQEKQAKLRAGAGDTVEDTLPFHRLWPGHPKHLPRARAVMFFP